jgi:hypothetical protein
MNEQGTEGEDERHMYLFVTAVAKACTHVLAKATILSFLKITVG